MAKFKEKENAYCQLCYRKFPIEVYKKDNTYIYGYRPYCPNCDDYYHAMVERGYSLEQIHEYYETQELRTNDVDSMSVKLPRTKDELMNILTSLDIHNFIVRKGIEYYFVPSRNPLFNMMFLKDVNVQSDGKITNFKYSFDIFRDLLKYIFGEVAIENLDKQLEAKLREARKRMQSLGASDETKTNL